jgi:arsenate reductase
MAEAIVNAELGQTWQAYSAGTEPTGEVHPKALIVLSELGIDHQGASKSVSEVRGIPFDLVVTVCDDAAENCPVWLGPENKVHIGFPDPAKATGTEEQILAEFRRIRDDIHTKIIDYLKQ